MIFVEKTKGDRWAGTVSEIVGRACHTPARSKKEGDQIFNQNKM